MVLVSFWSWQTLGVHMRLCLLVEWLEELEGVGWKELEVVGREFGLPGKLQALGFLRGLSAQTLFHGGGRHLDAGLRGKISVPRRDGIWNRPRPQPPVSGTGGGFFAGGTSLRVAHQLAALQVRAWTDTRVLSTF